MSDPVETKKRVAVEVRANQTYYPPPSRLVCQIALLEIHSSGFNDAILRHAGEASQVRARYQALTPTQKKQLITYLESL